MQRKYENLLILGVIIKKPTECSVPAGFLILLLTIYGEERWLQKDVILYLLMSYSGI